MKNSKTILTSFLNAMGTVVYVLLVSYVMFNGEQWFGKMNNMWGPFAMLLLLVLSTAIVGILIFGKPILLYLDNQKKKAVELLGSTIGWLFFATVTTLIIYAII